MTYGLCMEYLWSIYGISMEYLWNMYTYLYWLVVEPYPSEKYELVNWDDDIPNIWKNKKCAKPATS